jgi:4-hydroxy-2-oxoheptanedioate aldolase
MLETKESVTNLDEILRLKLLDIIYVGPFDLSISYGISPREIFENSEMLKIYKSILKTVKKAKKIAAIHCISAETAIYFLKMGFDFVTLSTDLALLKKSVWNEQDKVKNFLKNTKK